MTAASGKYEEAVRMVYAHDGSVRNAGDNYYGIDERVAWAYRHRMGDALVQFDRLEPRRAAGAFRRFARDYDPAQFLAAAADIHMARTLHKLDGLRQPAFYAAADMALTYGVHYALDIVNEVDGEQSGAAVKRNGEEPAKSYALRVNKREHDRLMEEYLCASERAPAIGAAVKRNERRRKFILHYVESR